MKYDFDTLVDRNIKIRGTGKYSIMRDSKGNRPPDWVVPLSVADMEFRTAPCIVEAIKSEADFGLWGYHMVTDSFRESCCTWMKERHNWEIQPEWIVPIEQVVPALYVALFAFTEPGDSVIVQTPAYHHFAGATIHTGRNVLENELLVDEAGRYTIDFDDLRRKAKKAKMMFLCSPHNPSGRVFTPDELRQIGEICLENHVLVVADEIHHDLIQKAFTHTVYASIGEKYAQNCVVCTSLSKTFNLAGLCFASIIIPNPVLRAQFQDTMSTHGFKHTSRFGPVAHEAAYRKGAEWLEELIDYIQGNYEYFKDFMKKKFPKVVITPLEGTYLAWFNCKSFGMTDEELRDFLTDDCQLYLDQGTEFGKAGSGYQRINLACPRKVLTEALDRLYAGAKERGLIEG